MTDTTQELYNLEQAICTPCDGKGEYDYQFEDGSVFPVICNYCNGSGKIVTTTNPVIAFKKEEV
jgi:DnaJ-class molecular chaperone